MMVMQHQDATPFIRLVDGQTQVFINKGQIIMMTIDERRVMLNSRPCVVVAISLPSVITVSFYMKESDKNSLLQWASGFTSVLQLEVQVEDIT